VNEREACCGAAQHTRLLSECDVAVTMLFSVPAAVLPCVSEQLDAAAVTLLVAGGSCGTLVWGAQRAMQQQHCSRPWWPLHQQQQQQLQCQPQKQLWITPGM
jgi:uncharacterized protein (UPF0261 family)